MSLEIALYTLFRKSVNFVTAGTVLDNHSSAHHCIVCTAIMSMRVGVSIDRLVQCFAAMSSRLVCMPKYGIPFVFGLWHPSSELTKYGESYVSRNWSKETVDLETLVSECKII